MTEQKQVDLVVRAQLKGVKDLESVSDAIDKVEKAIERQTDAAKRGENVIDELKGSLEALKSIQSELASGKGLFKTFNDLTKAVATSEEKLQKQIKRLDEFRRSLADTENLSKRQTNTLNAYNLAVQKSTDNVTKQRAAYDGFASTLREAGVNVNNLAAAEMRNLEVQAKLGAVYQRGSESVRGYSETVRAARLAEKELANEQVFQKKLQDAAQLAKSSEYVSFWTRALDEADRAEKELANNRALQKTAKDAQDAAKGYNSLARAATSLRPKATSLKDSIDALINPTKAARSTLAGLEKEVGDLASTIDGIKGPVSNYKGSIDALVSAQRELGRQSGLIDNFRRQVETLRAARAEYTQARAQVLQYAAAVKQGGEAGASYANALANAQARARGAAQALAQQIAVTRQSRQALREAGIATNDLAAAQSRMTATAQQSVAATRKLTDAANQYGQSVERAAKGGGLFRDEGRTTLSYLQRLRGEVLSLAAAYGGVFAAVNLAKTSIKAFTDQQTIESRLGVVIDSNDPEKIAKEYEYLRKTADYYGFSVRELAKSQGSYGIAARSAGYTTEQTRYTFEQLVSAMRVMKLDTDQSNRAFIQLQQILSKIRPEMEDFKTIAESGFAGIQGLAARGLRTIGVEGIRAGTEIGDMFALMRKGGLDSGQAIFGLARQIEIELGDRVPAAIKTLVAEQGRFETQVFDFQKEIANSGWAEAYTDALKEIAAFLTSQDGKNLAQSASAALTALAKAVVLVLENIEALKAAMVGLLLIWSAKQFESIYGRFRLIGKGVDGATASVGRLKKAFMVFQAFVVGWTIGTILYDKFKVVRDAGTWMATGLAMTWTWIVSSFEMAFNLMPLIVKNAFKGVLNAITLGARKAMGIFAAISRAAGFDKLADTLEQNIAAITLNYEDVGGELARRRAALKAELDRIRDIRSDMLKENARPPKAKPVVDAIEPTARPDTPAYRLGGSEGDAALNKRKSMIDGIERALESLDAKINRADRETLESQLKAIDLQYAELARKIATLGGAEANVFQQRLIELSRELRKQTADNFNKALEKEVEAVQRKIDSADAAAGRKDKANLQSRLDAITTTFKAHYDELNELREKFIANGRDVSVLDQAEGRLMGVEGRTKELETIKVQQEELARLEQRMNDIIQNREKLVAAVNTQKELGRISDEESTQQINDINTRAIPGIQAAAAETRAWALAHAAIFQRPEDMEVFLATLDAVALRATTINTKFTNLERSVIDGFVNGINTGLNTIVDSLQQVFTGQASVADGFRGMLAGFANFAAQFLRDIAVMIIKMQIFKALQNSGNPILAAVGHAGAATVKHSGGVIGSGSGRVRNISPAWFANAPRYHSGGISGLASDEYPAILQRGEEVLDKDSPRNVLNGGLTPQGGGSSDKGMRVVLVDDRSKVPEAMSSPEGEHVIVQAIRRNIPTIKQYLK